MINNIRAITIIEGPEEVFNSKEVNKPIVTDKIPINIATNTICFGLLVIFDSSHIISRPVIKRVPIIFIDNAMTQQKKEKMNYTYSVSFLLQLIIINCSRK